jgi:hypothetical protein
MATNITEVYVQKVKFKHLGEIGNVSFRWNKQNGRYSFYDGGDFETIVDDNSCHLVSVPAEIHQDPMLFMSNEDYPF